MDSHPGDGATDCDSVGDSGGDGVSGSGCDNGRRGDGDGRKGSDNGFDCDVDGNDTGVLMVIVVAESLGRELKGTSEKKTLQLLLVYQMCICNVVRK